MSYIAGMMKPPTDLALQEVQLVSALLNFPPSAVNHALRGAQYRSLHEGNDSLSIYVFFTGVRARPLRVHTTLLAG